MKLEPLGDKVIVRRIEAEATTAGGIVLPESAREKPRQGKVLSVGDGALGTSGVRARPQVAEGDVVLFSPYAGNEVSIDGLPVVILSEREILAIVDPA